MDRPNPTRRSSPVLAAAAALAGAGGLTPGPAPGPPLHPGPGRGATGSLAYRARQAMFQLRARMGGVAPNIHDQKQPKKGEQPRYWRDSRGRLYYAHFNRDGRPAGWRRDKAKEAELAALARATSDRGRNQRAAAKVAVGDPQ